MSELSTLLADLKEQEALDAVKKMLVTIWTPCRYLQRPERVCRWWDIDSERGIFYT
jgi:hypothetical protein